MNERIRELAEQANGPNPFFGQLKGQMVLTGNDAVEKFAELIVKECANIARQTETDDSDDYKSGRIWSSLDILEHFGVE